MLFKATCAQCGDACEVPFKPNGSKPVLCRNCFKKDGGGDARPFRGNDRGNDSRGSLSFDDKPKYKAICDTCGTECEVPFRPSGDRPVFCKGCFGNKHGGAPAEHKTFAPAPARTENYNEQFKALNAKLDAIMKLLSPSAPVKTAVEKPVAKETAAPVKEAAAPAKVAKKKATAKKKK